MKILKIKEYIKEKEMKNMFIDMDENSLSEVLTKLFVEFISKIKDCPIIYSESSRPPTVMLKTRYRPGDDLSVIVKSIYGELIGKMPLYKLTTIIFKSLTVTPPIYSPNDFELKKGIMARVEYIIQ